MRKLSHIALPFALAMVFCNDAYSEDEYLTPSGIVSKERQERCDKAFAALPPAVKDSMIDLSQRESLPSYEAQLKSYDDSCLERWTILKPKTREVVENVAGFFFLKQKDRTDAICAGFRVTEQHVATAGHCLWWRGAQIDASMLIFRLIGAPTLEFRPTGVDDLSDIDDERSLSDMRDYALLKVDTSAIPLVTQPDFFRGELPYKEYLLLPGFNVFDFISRKADLSGDWISSMRADKGRSCFRAQTDASSGNLSHCVFSACQTIEAMSGAPIFAYDFKKNMLFVGGIHLRAGLLDDDPQVRLNRECGSLSAYNVGITLPQPVLKNALQSGNAQ